MAWHKYIGALLGGTLTALLAWTVEVLAWTLIMAAITSPFRDGIWPGLALSVPLLALGYGLHAIAAQLFKLDDRLLGKQSVSGRSVFSRRVGRVDRERACVHVGSEIIYFGLRVAAKRDKAAVTSAEERTGAYVLCLITLLGLVMAMRRFLPPLSTAPALCVMLAIVLAPVARDVWRAYAGRRRALRSELPAVVGARYRVRCVGFPEDYEAFGGFGDRAFEPAIFNCSWTGLAFFRTPVRVFGGVATVLLAMLLCGASWLVLRDVGWALSVAPGLACAITAAFWHTYIRVVPGRLEILQMPVFSRKQGHSLTFDLRSTRVLVNSRRAYVQIRGLERGSGEFTFSTSLLPDRRRLEHVILLAAVSTHEPGPLEPETPGA